MLPPCTKDSPPFWYIPLVSGLAGPRYAAYRKTKMDIGYCWQFDQTASRT